MAKSIMQDEVECYYCRTTRWLERHHVFGGANRNRSERDGLTVYLCKAHHTLAPEGVHQNRIRMDTLRAQGQRAWMEHYGKTVEDFIAAYGKNYL